MKEEKISEYYLQLLNSLYKERKTLKWFNLLKKFENSCAIEATTEVLFLASFYETDPRTT